MSDIADQSESPVARPRVLLITFSFPPVGGVGVMRAASLARYLPENGFIVDVLTARNAPAVGKDPALSQLLPSDVAIVRTWTLDLPYTIRKRIRKLISPEAPNSPEPTPRPAATDAPRKRPSRIKSIVGNLLLPDPQVGWLPFAFRSAKRLIRTQGSDVVLITVPPFSSARLVTKLRRTFPNLPIVLDFRDEWLTTTLNLVSFNNNERARAVANRTESEAVRDATIVVLVTEAARRELVSRYPGEPLTKFRYVPNGFEMRGKQPTQEELSKTRTDSLVLTYIGSVYGSTDPGTFVEAVLSLPAEARKRLRIRFIGKIESLKYRASLERLGDSVDLIGFLPQAEALRALDDTDYLLLITHDHINVSAKFYDYLSGTKPILAAVHPSGDVRRLLEATGAGFWADVQSPSAISAMLLQVLMDGAPSHAVRDEALIATFDRRALTAQYAGLLRDVVQTGQLVERS